MATRANLIETYNSNPTLQSRYTLQQYLDLFGFGATTTPTPDPTPTPTPTPEQPGIPNIINQNLNQGGGGEGPPPGPTFNRNDLLGTSDYQGTGPGFFESIMGVPAALANAYTQISPINLVRNLFKKKAVEFNQVNLDAIAKEKQRQEIERQLAFEQAARDRDTYAGLEKAIKEGRDTSGFDRPSSGPTAAGAGMGVGGGYASDYGFADGGRVYLYNRLK